jgi:folylpolyglutamate synthase/dihydropteroate synthase
LGAGRKAIAADKGRALVAAEMAVIGSGLERDLISELGAPHAVGAESLVWSTSDGAGRLKLAWTGGESAVQLPLAGCYQRDNAQLALALALRACEAGWLPRLDPMKVQSALESLHWPGRLSMHRISGREVLVDCAHNLEAARSLTRYLETLEDRYNLVFSCLDDKPVREMAAELRSRVDKIVVCQLADERAMPVGELLSAFPEAMTAETPLQCLDLLDDPVLAAGSIRLVGQLLTHEDLDG